MGGALYSMVVFFEDTSKSFVGSQEIRDSELASFIEKFVPNKKGRRNGVVT